MNTAPTLRLQDFRTDTPAQAVDGLAELRQHWPALSDPVKDAVLTLVRSAAGIPSADSLPIVLDIVHVTKLLGVSRSTVDRMDAEEKIPAPIRAGRSKKWDRDGFLIWLRTRRPDGEPFTRAEWARQTN